MIKWEYSSVITDSLENPKFKAMGDDGWEPVGLCTAMVQTSIMTKPTIAFTILLKRMKTESTN